MALNLTYTQDRAYQSIFHDYIAGLKRLAEFKKWQTENKVVITEMEKLKKELAQKYKAFVDGKIAELGNQMATIERRYKSTRSVYEKPEVELLRRQDFDLEFSTWGRDDVIHHLQDENKTFSRYELAKIKATYREDTQIQRLLHALNDTAEDAYMRDPEYIFLAEQHTILSMTRHHGLSLVYLPAANDKGHESLSLDLRNLDKSPQMIALEIEKISDLLANMPKGDKQEWQQLQTFKPNKAATLQYEEFDKRIFRGAEDYDVTHRFKYLKERFTDGQTDMWDFTRDDYDPMAHFRHLEHLHDLKMKNDPDYKRRYQEAEREALASNKGQANE